MFCIVYKGIILDFLVISFLLSGIFLEEENIMFYGLWFLVIKLY